MIIINNYNNNKLKNKKINRYNTYNYTLNKKQIKNLRNYIYNKITMLHQAIIKAYNQIISNNKIKKKYGQRNIT